MSQNQPQNPSDRPADAPGYGQQPERGNPAEQPQTPGQSNPDIGTPGRGNPGQGNPGREMPTDSPLDNPQERTSDRPAEDGDDNSFSDLREEGDHRV